MRVAAAMTAVVLIGSGTAYAAWGANGTGTAAAAGTRLPTPASVSATCSTVDTITVSWTTTQSAPLVAAFQVDRTADTGATWSTIATVTAVAGTTSYQHADGPLLGGTYSYRVTATNNGWTATSATSASRTITEAVTTGPKSSRKPASCT